MKTTRKSKTFQDGDEVGIPLMWANDLVWKYVGTNDFVDPADAEWRLKNKIKITIEVYEDNTSFNGDLSVETYRDLSKHLQNETDN